MSMLTIITVVPLEFLLSRLGCYMRGPVRERREGGGDVGLQPGAD